MRPVRKVSQLTCRFQLSIQLLKILLHEVSNHPGFLYYEGMCSFHIKFFLNVLFVKIHVIIGFVCH